MDLAPPPTSQDICKYKIHFPPSASDPQQLLAHRAEILALVATLSRGYIWHKQPFNLSLSPLAFTSSANSPPQYLQGSTDVSDAVDDEWFIVFLLKRIAEEFSLAVISVDDNDGEFLMIEAAEVLPRWVTPTNAANRVWIHGSDLHLVPLEHVSAMPFATPSTEQHIDEDGFIDMNTALELVRASSVDTRAPTDVQGAVWSRIAGYPEKFHTQHLHHTLAYLPEDIALALQDSPELVAEAVAAFYERDPAGLKACNRMARFPPSTPSPPSTTTSASSDSSPTSPLTRLILTRPLYSQLVLQRFFAPKPFDHVKWMESRAPGSAREVDERRRSVGMKLACGFEILYARTRPLPRTTSSDTDQIPDGQRSAYEAYLSSLSSRNYFEGETRGSKRWTELELLARKGWLDAAQTETYADTAEGAGAGAGEARTKSFAQRVDEAVERARAAGGLKSLSDVELDNGEDSESWMAVDEQGLEEMLARRGPGGDGVVDDEDFLEDSDDEEGDSDADEDAMEGVQSAAGDKEEERRAKKVAKQLEKMAGKVEEFVEGRGALEGAEFDDEHSDEDEDEDDDDDAPQMTAEERAARLEKLVAPLGVDEWGQKERVAQDDRKAALPSLAANEALTRPSKLTEEHYDGASSDDDDSDEDQDMPADERVQRAEDGEQGEEDDPSVVGLGGEGEEGQQVEMDMQEEMDEFLKFATETLGLTEEQYGKILGERRSRGAFVPGPAKPKKTNVVPSASSSKSTAAPGVAAAAAAAPKPTVPQPPLRNPNLTDFDALMEQMDAELAKVRTSASASGPGPAKQASPSATAKPKPSAKPTPQSSTRIVVDSGESDDDEPLPDDLAAMDAELASLFKKVNGGGDGDEDGDGSSGPVDYNLVKNFLESFQSQGGFGGPAGSMAGRLGFNLPRDA